jgi:lipopolysaccharide transport system permease protein
MENRVVIEHGGKRKNYWKALWNFRELFYFFAWRDILVRYKQTTIGIAWSILRPLLTMGLMWFIGWIFNSSVPEGVPRILLVGAATLPWQFFSSSFSEASNSLIGNSNLLTKVYFPRLIIPLSTVVVCLVDFFISFSILIVLMFALRFVPDSRILFLPVFLIIALLTAIGSGLFVAALNVKYRDFKFIIPFIVQFGIYVSPVAFSSSIVYQSTRIPGIVKFIYSLNPMVGVIDGFRWCILGNSTPIYMPGFLPSIAITFFLVVLGIWYFRKTENSFADVI